MTFFTQLLLLISLILSGCATQHRVGHESQVATLGRSPANDVTGRIPLELKDGQEYASMEKVRFAKIKNQNTGEVWTMAVVGHQSSFHDATPKGPYFPNGRSPIHNNPTLDSNFGILAGHIRKQAMTWDIQRYKEEYPNIDPTFFDQMLKKDPGLDEGSVLIVIFKENDASQILATFRVAYQDAETSLLPLDQLHGRQISPTVEFPDKAETFLDLDIQTGETTPKNLKHGYKLEFKNFVKDPRLGPEISPLMFMTAEQLNITKRIMIHNPTMGRAPVDQIGLVSEYYLVANERMKPYYTRFGFEVVEENIEGSGDLVMKIDRTKFAQRLQKLWVAEGGKIVRGQSTNFSIDYDAYVDLYKNFNVRAAGGKDPLDLLKFFKLDFDPDSCGYLLKNNFILKMFF